MIGFAATGTNLLVSHVGAVANSWSYYCANGNKYISGAASAFASNARTGDKIIMKFSFDSPTVKVFKNTVLVGYISGIIPLFLYVFNLIFI